MIISCFTIVVIVTQTAEIFVRTVRRIELAPHSFVHNSYWVRKVFWIWWPSPNSVPFRTCPLSVFFCYLSVLLVFLPLGGGVAAAFYFFVGLRCFSCVLFPIAFLCVTFSSHHRALSNRRSLPPWPLQPPSTRRSLSRQQNTTHQARAWVNRWLWAIDSAHISMH